MYAQLLKMYQVFQTKNITVSYLLVCRTAYSKYVLLKSVFSLLLQEEKKRKREKEQCDTEGEADDFDPGKKVEVEPPPDRPVRACRTQPGEQCEKL